MTRYGVKIALMASVVATVLTACNSPFLKFEDSEKNTVMKTGNKKEGGFDTGRYIDFSHTSIKASNYTIDDFFAVCSGVYESSGIFIEVNNSKKVITLRGSTNNIQYDIAYTPILKAANEDCAYLAPNYEFPISLYTNGEETDSCSLPAFFTFIALHGIGENRIEVSSVLQEKSMVSGKTYWKKK